MSSVLERAFAVIELLSDHPDGLSVSAIAAHVDMPTSGTHRLLNQLMALGYVRQDKSLGDYALSIKMAAFGLGFLGRSGITEITQPIIDHLARQSGELVRLSVIDGDNLIWVGVAQGATGGLRYDPGREQGVVAHLASSSSGLAWLSTMSDADALMRVANQGFALATSGPNAPTDATALLDRLAQTRKRGFSLTVDTFMPGMSAMAAPVRRGTDDRVIGAVSIAGPSVRFTEARMLALGDALRAAARELGHAAPASGYFARTGDQSSRQERKEKEPTA